MKSLLSQITKTIIPWATVIALLVLLTKTCSEHSPKPDCPDCHKERTRIEDQPKDEDNELVFEYEKQNKFQPIHMDMVHNFGILAKMTYINDTLLEKVEFRLKEPENVLITHLEILNL